MAKDRTDKTWVCGDCNAIHSRKVKFCNAPNHDLHVALFKAEHHVRELEAKLAKSRTMWYMPRARFVKEYTAALEEFLAQAHPGEEPYHPYDLACSTATFNDAFFALASNMEFRPTET